jgi:transcriptional regulator of acetoin/glycerol metabolism
MCLLATSSQFETFYLDDAEVERGARDKTRTFDRGCSADLPSTLVKPRGGRMPSRDEILPLEELERRAILQSVRETEDKLAAARMLGIGKTTLYCKLKAYKVTFVD